MQVERKKLKRLKRLEHIRSLTKQSALAEVARAEVMLGQLQMLSNRTADLVADYADRPPAITGSDLRNLVQFTDALQLILKSTQTDTVKAAAFANQSQTALAHAEQRRSAVETRADALSQKINAHQQQPLHTARRANGTPLE